MCKRFEVLLYHFKRSNNRITSAEVQGRNSHRVPGARSKPAPRPYCLQHKKGNSKVRSSLVVSYIHCCGPKLCPQPHHSLSQCILTTGQQSTSSTGTDHKTQSHRHLRSVCGAFGNPSCLQGRVPSLWRSACCTPVALWLRLPSPTTTGRHVTCLTAQGEAQNSPVGVLAEVDSVRVAHQPLS